MIDHVMEQRRNATSSLPETSQGSAASVAEETRR
jgi:hypothetical protein